MKESFSRSFRISVSLFSTFSVPCRRWTFYLVFSVVDSNGLHLLQISINIFIILSSWKFITQTTTLPTFKCSDQCGFPLSQDTLKYIDNFLLKMKKKTQRDCNVSQRCIQLVLKIKKSKTDKCSVPSRWGCMARHLPWASLLAGFGDSGSGTVFQTEN